MSILQSLRTSYGRGIFYHRLVDINAYYLNLGIFERHIKRPASWAAGDVKYRVNIRHIMMSWKQLLSGTRKHCMQINETSHGCYIIINQDTAGLQRFREMVIILYHTPLSYPTSARHPNKLLHKTTFYLKEQKKTSSKTMYFQWNNTRITT